MFYFNNYYILLYYNVAALQAILIFQKFTLLNINIKLMLISIDCI